jgi:hypothetical protein
METTQFCDIYLYLLEGQAALTEHHAMKAYWASGGIAPRIIDVVTPRPFYLQGKSPWYSLDRRLGGPQSRSGRGGEEKNFQPQPGIEP